MLSFIEAHEAEEGKAFVEQQMGFSVPPLYKDFIAVKLFIRDEDIFTFADEQGKEVKTVSCYEKFHSCVALVVGMGKGCEEPAYRVGDFIMIPRNEGQQVNCRGYVLHFLKYNKVYAIVDKPEEIERV
jgi:hypothetical protein